MKKIISAVAVGLLSLAGCSSANYLNRDPNSPYNYPPHDINLEDPSSEFANFYGQLAAGKSVFYSIADIVTNELNSIVTKTIAETNFTSTSLNEIKAIFNISAYNFDKDNKILDADLKVVELLDFQFKATITVSSNDLFEEIGAWVGKYYQFINSDFADTKQTFLPHLLKLVDEQFYQPSIALYNKLKNNSATFAIDQIKIFDDSDFQEANDTNLVSLISQYNQLNKFQISGSDFADSVYNPSATSGNNTSLNKELGIALSYLISENQKTKNGFPNFFLANIPTFVLDFENLSLISNSDGIFYVIHFNMIFNGNNFGFDVTYNCINADLYVAFQTVVTELQYIRTRIVSPASAAAKKIELSNFLGRLQSVINGLSKYEEINGVYEVEYVEEYGEHILYTPYWFLLFSKIGPNPDFALAFIDLYDEFIAIPSTDSRYNLSAGFVLEEMLLNLVIDTAAIVLPYSLNLPEAFRTNYDAITANNVSLTSFRYSGVSLNQLLIEYQVGGEKIYVKHTEHLVFGLWWYFNVEPNAIALSTISVKDLIAILNNNSHASYEAYTNAIDEYLINGFMTICVGLINDEYLSLTDAIGYEITEEKMLELLNL